jgi:predicted MFS family arabinose efflux permease
MNQTSSPTLSTKSHYASLLPALALGLGVAICHGIGRFAYALIMPAMQADLGWTYAQASWMNTANALGYILGTVSGFLLLAHLNAKHLFRIGLLLCSASVLLMALKFGFTWYVFVRLLSGLGAAWAFSTGGTLVAERFPGERDRGTATGIFFGSAGFGMILTALITPGLFEFRGSGAWPTAWLLLGLGCCIAMIWPLWETCESSLASGHSSGKVPSGFLMLWRPMLAYFVFAMSHTGYAFLVFAWMRSQSLPWFHGSGMWVLLGIGVLFSAILWKQALARWPGAKILMSCCLAVGIFGAVPLVQLDVATMYISALLVGSSLFIAPSAMAVLARQKLPPHDRAMGFMIFSIVFSVGQALGSWGFGQAADGFSLSWVLAASSIGLLLAAVIAWTGTLTRSKDGIEA